MKRRAAITVMLLVFWIFLGPVAMAFDGCAATGATCGGPCATPSCAVLGQVFSIAPAPVSSLYVVEEGSLPENGFAGLEPPPKFVSRSA